MEFAFPKIENRIVYPRTFLKDVRISLCFRPVLSSEDAIKRFIDFRKDCFNIPLEENAMLKPSGEDGSAKIASSDNQVLFYFFLDSVSLKIKFPTYKQIGNLMSFMPGVYEFLKSQGIDSIEKLRITKFNEIQYGFQSDSSSVELAMEGIFSRELMTWDGFKNPDFSDVARWERRVDFSDDHSQANAMVMYGFVKDDNDRRKGSLTLKTSVEQIKSIKCTCIEEELDLCNVFVDSAFHWSASSAILNAMQKK